MKLHILLTAVVLCVAVLVQAQPTPAPQTTKSVGGFSNGDAGGAAPAQKQRDQASADSFDVNGDPSFGNRMEEIVNLPSGPLENVVTELQRHFKDNPTKPDAFLPNIVYAKETRDAVVPGELTLRRVTPLQALALVVAAAECRLEPVFAPAESGNRRVVTGFGNGETGAGASPPIIGYRVLRASALNRQTSPRAQQLAELTQRLATMRTSLTEDHPSVVGLRERIRNLEAEGGEEPGALSGVGLVLSMKDGTAVVRQIISGSPASFDPTIQPGQQVLRVAEAGKREVDVTGLKLENVVQLLRGSPGTSVKITFGTDTDKDLTNHTVSLVRATIPTVPSNGMPPQVKELDPESGWQSSSFDTFGNRLSPAGARVPTDHNRRFVRVYALGSILSGGGKESEGKQRQCQDLIQMTLHQAELDTKTSPDLSFHQDSRVLVVKSTAAQHEMIGQVIKALRDNEGQQSGGTGR